MNGEEAKSAKEVPALPIAASSQTRQRKTAKKALKSWAWRLTATVIWLQWLSFLLTGKNVFEGTQRNIVSKAVSFLSAIGFAPVNADYLPRALKFAWVLLITGFSPSQFLVGLPLYITVFPFTVGGYLVFHEALEAAPRGAEANGRAGLRPKVTGFPLTAIATSSLLVWLVLYGGSLSRGPTLVGWVLSGILFLTLAYRAFQRATPVDETDTAVFGMLAVKGHEAAMQAIQNVMQAPPTTKMAAISAMRVQQLIYINLFRRITIFFRGRRGRDRVAVVILLEYVVSLVFLAGSAILFWAFALRVAHSSEMIPLAMSLRMSASHFLPGVGHGSPPNLPWWAEFGPALTSWILFVVYVGPAASILPRNQEDFVKRMAPSYRLLRKTVLLWRKYRQMMEVLKSRLT
jgi:hypothetical protein